MIEQQTLDTFRDKVKAVAREMGLECPKMNISYLEHGFSFRGDVYDGDKGYREEFTRVANRKGFPASWYGQIFTTKEGEYKITNANMRGRKYPIIGTRLRDNAKFKFSVEQVQRGNPLNVVQSQVAIEEK